LPIYLFKRLKIVASRLLNPRQTIAGMNFTAFALAEWALPIMDAKL